MQKQEDEGKVQTLYDSVICGGELGRAKVYAGPTNNTIESAEQAWRSDDMGGFVHNRMD